MSLEAYLESSELNKPIITAKKFESDNVGELFAA